MARILEKMAATNTQMLETMTAKLAADQKSILDTVTVQLNTTLSQVTKTLINKLEDQTVLLSQLTSHGDAYQAKLTAHKKRMDDMDTMLTKVSNNINMAATQHNLLMAQMEGIRTNAKDAAVAAQHLLRTSKLL